MDSGLPSPGQGGRHPMSRRHVTVIAACILALSVSAAQPGASAQTTSQADEINWLAAGDSYSSGTGAEGVRDGLDQNAVECWQTEYAYAPRASETLSDTGFLNLRSFDFVACHGAKIKDDDGDNDWMRQIDKRRQDKDAKYNIVTMSFGGNDIEFADVIKDCLTVWPDSWIPLVSPAFAVVRAFDGCDVDESELEKRIDSLKEVASGLFEEIATNHLTDHGRLYVVGYPQLFAPTEEWSGSQLFHCWGILKGDATMLSRVATHLKETLRDVANAVGDGRVVFLDTQKLYRDGKHELCGTNSDWLHGMHFERFNYDRSFHPNTEGHSATGKALVDLIKKTLPLQSEPRNFKAVAAGKDHSCAIGHDNAITCWGSNNNGQSTRPAGTYRTVAAGDEYSCAIGTDDTIRCWGSIPTPPSGTYKAIAAGSQHACAITTNDIITCWGNNDYGQSVPPTGTHKAIAASDEYSCAIGTDDTIRCWGSIPTSPSGTYKAGTYQAIAAGSQHACAITTNDIITCWGNNDYGQSVPPTGTHKAIAAGDEYSCAIGTDDTIRCWGSIPTPPSGTYKAIAAGSQHACAITTNDTITCWGNNDYGQSDPPRVMALIDGLPEASGIGSLSSFWDHVCLDLGAGAGILGDLLGELGELLGQPGVLCWGGGTSDLMDAPPEARQAPSAGAAHACAIDSDGAAACWGNGFLGQTDAPEGPFSQFAAGWDHTCGLSATGVIQCWGSDAHGQSSPPSGRFAAISSGDGHSCALGNNGGIQCWGLNGDGQSSAPQGRYVALDTGSAHSCALDASLAVVCWGANWFGQTDAPEGRYEAVAAGYGHSCALDEDGIATCWGLNDSLQSNPPQRPFTSITVGRAHTCALTPQAEMLCWGTMDSEDR